MPDPKPESPRNRLIKIALIPVLAIVLIVVMLPGSEQTDPEFGLSDEAQATLDASGTGGTIIEVGPESEAADARAWPELSLRDILSHNPFEVPRALDPTPDEVPVALEEAAAVAAEQKQAEELSGTIAALKQTGVGMIFRGKGGTSAMVGSRVIREGDMLGENLRVLRIDEKGVVVDVIAPER